MKAILTGGTGMVGGLVLTNCLNNEKVTEVISLVRKPSGHDHPKITEVVIENFEDYAGHENLFKKVAVAFFCLGAYTGQFADDVFKKITVDYAVQFAKALEENSPNSTLCLLSGAGADRTEKSKMSFARYKGMAENQIAAISPNFYTFRPAYIYPVAPRKEPNFGYRLMRSLFPLLRLFGKKHSIKSTELANAMFYVGLNGAEDEILENEDILDYSAF